MKATGIVRRIDDLGRVVIPKEIRRTMRIREGDPLEIYTGTSGEIVFKKYSPMGEMAVFAAQYAEVLFKTAELPVIICDRDHVIAAAGVPKREVLERRVSTQLEDLMVQRKNYQKEGPEGIYPIEGFDRMALVAVPIVSNGDLGGTVLLLASDTVNEADELQMKLVSAGAMFLSKQMEP